MLSEKNWMAEKLRPHVGHNIVCVYYGDADNPVVDVCIECEDCNEVLVSAEDYNDKPATQIGQLKQQLREWEKFAPYLATHGLLPAATVMKPDALGGWTHG